MEKPPLFYITAAGFAKLFSFFLPLHDGARLASGFYILVALIFVGLTARELYGRRHGIFAPLILMSCIGLQTHAHKLITDNALLTGFAVSIYGLTLTKRRFAFGGFLTGTGTGIGFMSKGLLAPGILGIIIVLLPVLFKDWRRWEYFWSLLVASAAILPWCLIWPWALYDRSPQLFTEWLWTQNLGRFLGFADQGPPNKHGLYFYTLPWFAWPAIPVAAWTVWYKRGSLLEDDAYRLPLLVFIVMFGVLSLASDGRGLYALPMLLPLSVIAAAKADLLPSCFGNSLKWLGIVGAGLSAGILWFGWLALLTGTPVPVAAKLHAISPGYEPTFITVASISAATFTLLWVFLLVKKVFRSWIISWVAGMTLVWALMMTLWLPWTDAQRSYKPMIASLMMQIPANHGCIASKAIGESERAMLEYFGGILTQRQEVQGMTDCGLLLRAGDRQFLKTSAPGPAWSTIWEGHRAGDEKVIFQLDQRQTVR